jgi:hypothetical protein
LSFKGFTKLENSWHWNKAATADKSGYKSKPFFFFLFKKWHFRTNDLNTYFEVNFFSILSYYLILIWFYDLIWSKAEFWRWVTCSKVICSKKLLDTKISTAWHQVWRGGRNVEFHYYDWQFFSECQKWLLSWSQLQHHNVENGFLVHHYYDDQNVKNSIKSRLST